MLSFPSFLFFYFVLAQPSSFLLHDNCTRYFCLENTYMLFLPFSLCMANAFPSFGCWLISELTSSQPLSLEAQLLEPPGASNMAQLKCPSEFPAKVFSFLYVLIIYCWIVIPHQKNFQMIVILSEIYFFKYPWQFFFVRLHSANKPFRGWALLSLLDGWASSSFHCSPRT